MRDAPFNYKDKTLEILDQVGCLLVSGNIENANVMTIGWGSIGPFWGKPFFIVAIRPSRYTFKFIEKTNSFTVNVPTKGMEKIVEFCGSVSGKDHNKILEKNLILSPSKKVDSPIITNCFLHYECKVTYKTIVSPNNLSSNVKKTHYSNADYHTIYFGEILEMYSTNP